MIRSLLALSVLTLLLPGCFGSTGEAPPEIVVPETFSGEPLGHSNTVPPSGRWFVDEVVEGWSYWIQPVSTPFSGAFSASLEPQNPETQGVRVLSGVDVATAPVGQSVLAMSGFAAGGFGSGAMYSVGHVSGDHDAPAWLVMAAFAERPARVRLEIDFGGSETHHWSPVRLSSGPVEQTMAAWPNDGAGHRLSTYASAGSVMAVLDGQSAEGAFQSLELIGHQPYRVFAQGRVEGSTNSGAIDVAAILAAPADNYTLTVSEEGGSDSRRDMRLVSQSTDLGAWFEKQFGRPLYWDLTSDTFDQALFDDGR